MDLFEPINVELIAFVPKTETTPPASPSGEQSLQELESTNVEGTESNDINSPSQESHNIPGDGNNSDSNDSNRDPNESEDNKTNSNMAHNDTLSQPEFVRSIENASLKPKSVSTKQFELK